MTQRPNPILSLVDSTLKIEILAFVLAFITLIWTLDTTLIGGQTTLTHDAFYFTLPLYHHLINSLETGVIPYWNPYTHAGEPIYPSLFHCQFYDPISLLVAYFGPLFTPNRTLLFNWNHFIHSGFMLVGSYLFLRKLTRVPLTRILLIALLFFSSFNLASYRQIGFLYQFQWVPWVIWAFNRIFSEQKNDWKDFALLGSLIGLQMQSYWFAGLAVLILFAGIAFLMFYRTEIKSLPLTKFFYRKCALTLFVVALASAPNLVLFFSQNQWRSSARTNQNLSLLNQAAPKLYEDALLESDPISHFSWEQVKASGTSVNLWNFLQLLSHRGNPFIHPTKYNFGKPSEAWMYFGIIPLGLMLLGIFHGRSKEKNLWLVLLFGTGVLMLGQNFPLNRIIFELYPPIRVLRHYSTLTSLFSFTLFYFFIRGTDHLLENKTPSISVFKQKLILAIVSVMALTVTYWNPFPKFYLLYISVLGLIPLALILILRKHKKSPVLIQALLIGAILFDLACATSSSRSIYKGQFSPEIYLPIKKPAFPIHREAYPQYPLVHFQVDPYPEQNPRYLGIYYQKTYALSELLGREGEYDLTFEEALKSRRWNSFLLQKTYIQLINSEIPSLALKQIFAIHQPTIQFKSSAIIKHLNEIGHFLKATKHPDELLKHTILIDSDSGISQIQRPSLNLEASHLFLSQNTNQLTIEIKANEDSFLYWSDGYDPNWRAFIDEKRVPILRANINFKAVQISKGRHRLKFIFQPMWFKFALALFYMGVTIPIIASFLLSVGKWPYPSISLKPIFLNAFLKQGNSNPD